MFTIQRERCSVDSITLAASIFCRCGVPFSRRFRNIPCYHVHCSPCNDKGHVDNKCITCKSGVEKAEELHPNEDLLICTVDKCNKGFLNFPSLRVHLELTHAVSVNSFEDFYGEFGDSDIKIAETNVIKYKPPKEFEAKGDDEMESLGAGGDTDGHRAPKRRDTGEDDTDGSDDIDILI